MAWFDQDPQDAARMPIVTVTGPIASPTSGLGFAPLTAMDIAPAEPMSSPTSPDERPTSRASFHHAMLRTALGGNYLAPIGDPQYILDVGYGSGRWAHEMAGQFPRSRVVGVDIVPPPSIDAGMSGSYGLTRSDNLAFEQADVLEGLPFAPGAFDFVHQRLLFLAIPRHEWRRVASELARVTRTGGWVELVEGDLVRNGGPALDTLEYWITTLAHQRGIDPRAGGRVGDLLHDAGLSQVVSLDFELPIGDHGGRFGKLMEGDFFARVGQVGAMAVSSGLAAPQEYASFVTALHDELASYQYTQPFHVAYGRR
jgi:ubiquinone/menaquinone biosynthesis C-methylase UbiE